MTVIYDPAVHRSVFFTLHGSVWPNVIGWCILNCLVTYGVWTLKHNYDYDLTYASTGHDLLSLLISFLVVSHVSTAYARFWEARAYLSTMFSSCRKLSQKVAIYTMDIDNDISNVNDSSDSENRSKLYRQSIEKWLLELMYATMNVIEDEKQALFFAEGTCVESIMMTRTRTTTTTTAQTESGIDADGKDKVDDNVGTYNNMLNNNEEIKKILNKRLLGNVQSFKYLQDPMELAGMLQATIMSHERVLKTTKLIRFELELLGCVNVIIDTYIQLLKFVTTPIPFPLVQMGRTTLFIWIFTLSGVLVHNVYDLIPNLVVIFFITYGFVGLMYVSIELHDPFGKDPNDFEIGRYTNVTALGIKEDLSDEGTKRFQRASSIMEHKRHRHHHKKLSSSITKVNEHLLQTDDSETLSTMLQETTSSSNGGSTDSDDNNSSGLNNSDTCMIPRTTYNSIAPYVTSWNTRNNATGNDSTPNSTGGRRSAYSSIKHKTHRKTVSEFATNLASSFTGRTTNKPNNTTTKQRSSSYGHYYGSTSGEGSSSTSRLLNTWRVDENDDEQQQEEQQQADATLLP